MSIEELNFDELDFGFTKTDTMFVSTYEDESWNDGKLVPFKKIKISPGACILHYGQGIFEGLKAYRAKNGEITLFRPKLNAKRFNNSANRLVMPHYSIKGFLKAIKEVIKANESYIPPYETGGALYIRPLMIGCNPVLGVAPADKYKFIVFTCPVGPYFEGGFDTIHLKITKEYVRAAPGGTGDAKTGCNYGPTLKPAKEAKQQGFNQVLYLDAVHREYVEEAGTANFFAVIDDTLVTPPTRGTILPGITRKSVLEIAEKKLGMNTEERKISFTELFQDSCTEAFCTGTAAVITPIGGIKVNEERRIFNDDEPGEITTELYDYLTGLQRLEIEDDFAWVTKVQ